MPRPGRAPAAALPMMFSIELPNIFGLEIINPL